MKSKIWIGKSGEQIEPERNTHYEIHFYPVAGSVDNTFVIAVHICHYPGGVFFKEPICSVLDDNNQFVNMEFKRWLSLHRPTGTVPLCDIPFASFLVPFL
jgi:hypothetical protein